MKFNYKLSRLCGAYYGHSVASNDGGGSALAGYQWSGSNVIYDSTGNLLISAVSNRIQVIDLKALSVRTLVAEARSNILRLALSPDDTLLVAVDVKGYGLLINFHRGIILHRICFQHRLRDIKFSPDGRYLSVTHGKAVQVWCTPSMKRKEHCPLVLHRTFAGLSDDVTCLDWSNDCSVLVGGSRDNTIRIWTVHKVQNYEPYTLAGHTQGIIGVHIETVAQSQSMKNLFDGGERLETIYSVSKNGTLCTWSCSYDTPGQVVSPSINNESADQYEDDSDESDPEHLVVEEHRSNKRLRLSQVGQDKESPNECASIRNAAQSLVGATWTRTNRHFFDQDRADVTATAYNKSRNILAVGFSNGVFGIYELPTVSNIHTLSIGTNILVKACSLNLTGEWLALGCPQAQQLLVWEWTSETYVLKQRGHAYGMTCMAYSPDGIIICTGGEDGKLKLWNSSSGFCYVTFDKGCHTAPVTGVVFANSSVVLSASLDGTVKAHDLHRYRTFKTFTTPNPVQFISIAVDPSGEIICAGTADPFHIYVWNIQTAKILDVFTGHTGPICALHFQPTGGILVSGSWDGTVKMWDLYKGDLATESLLHTTDVVCVACRPDGKQICAGNIGGLLSFWNVEHAKLMFEIDGRRDIAGGRKLNDRMVANNNAASRYFTSVSYSADGVFLLAGGNSKYICIYEISQQILVKKIQITFNRSLDGVLDELNSRNLVDGIVVDDHADLDDVGGGGTGYVIGLPGAKRGDDGSRTSRVEVLTRQLQFSSTGREWAAITGEGLHVYSLDDEMVFDPLQLTEAITPAAVEKHMKAGEYSLALKLSLHLNETELIQTVLEQTPFESIPFVAKAIPTSTQLRLLERLLQVIAKALYESPHIEFYVQWSLQMLQIHGLQLEKHRSSLMRSFRAMYKALFTKYEELKSVSNENKFMLLFLEDQSKLLLQSPSDQNDVSTDVEV